MTSDEIKAHLELHGDGHIHWTGARSSKGYATVWYQGRTYLVHTLLYRKRVEAIKPKHVLRRQCDDAQCVAWDHYSQVLRNAPIAQHQYTTATA